MNIVTAKLNESCLNFKDRIAIKDKDKSLTYSDFYLKIKDCRLIINSLIEKPNSRIAIVLNNCTEYLELYYSIIDLEHIPFLIDYNIGVNELQILLDSCSVDYLFTDKKKFTDISPNVQLSKMLSYEHVDLTKLISVEKKKFELKKETITCRFTSGSNGIPKCLEFSSDAIYNSATNWVVSTNINKNDKVLCMAALSNGLAFNTSVLSIFLSGAGLYFYSGLITVGNIVEYINTNQISRLVSYPTFYRLMASDEREFELQNLKVAISAGSKLWIEIRNIFKKRWDLNIADYYGIAETGPVTFENHDESQGLPILGAKIKISSKNNEVLVKTNSMCSGYLTHPNMFENNLCDDGFYRTKDTGYILNGRLYITGRLDNLINIGGKKFDPDELINAVFAIDGVIDAAVFTNEDSNLENTVNLLVVKKTELELETISIVLKNKLSAYKYPGKIDIVDFIPRNGIGKIVHQIKK